MHGQPQIKSIIRTFKFDTVSVLFADRVRKSVFVRSVMNPAVLYKQIPRILKPYLHSGDIDIFHIRLFETTDIYIEYMFRPVTGHFRVTLVGNMSEGAKCSVEGQGSCWMKPLDEGSV